MPKIPPAPMLPPSPQAQKWNQAYLNEMRKAGDELADKTAESIFGPDAKKDNDKSIWDNLRKIATNRAWQSIPDFPMDLANYFEKGSAIPDSFNFYTKDENGFTGEDKIRLAARMFDKYGFYIVGLLFFKSLPTGYMAPYPSKVLAGTQLLDENTTRRLLETAQMIFDVSHAGWYKENGDGISSVLKVRLMHAGMRYGLQNDDVVWDKDSEVPLAGIPLGLPINQEDMVLTLNIFSIIIIEGLEQLGIVLTQVEREAHFYNWRLVGHFIGVHEDLNPATIEDAWYLQKTIENRLYHHENKDGAQLTRDLLGVVTKHVPGKITKNLMEDLTLYFLKYPKENPLVAPSLGLHKPNAFERFMDKVAHFIIQRVDKVATVAGKAVNEAETLENRLKSKNSYLGAIALVIIRPFKIGHIAWHHIRMELFEHICKSLMIHLQVKAEKTSNGRPLFFSKQASNPLFEKWELGGFDMNAFPMDKIATSAKVQKVIGAISMVAAPGVAIVTLYDFYNVQFQNADPMYPFGKPEGIVDGVIPANYTIEMLGVGILFLLVSVFVYIAMLGKSKLHYLRFAYLFIVGAIILWISLNFNL